MRKNKGWPNEKARHGASSRGISTKEMQIKQRKIWEEERQDLIKSIKSMFKPGGIAYNKPHFDDDWFRFYPDGTFDTHELCTGCNPDGTCDFHPKGCDCSQGSCQIDMGYESLMPEIELISYRTTDDIPQEVKEELIEEFRRGLRANMNVNDAIISATQHITDKIDEDLEHEDKELDLNAFITMEKYLLKYSEDMIEDMRSVYKYDEYNIVNRQFPIGTSGTYRNKKRKQMRGAKYGE